MGNTGHSGFPICEVALIVRIDKKLCLFGVERVSGLEGTVCWRRRVEPRELERRGFIPGDTQRTTIEV